MEVSWQRETKEESTFFFFFFFLRVYLLLILSIWCFSVSPFLLDIWILFKLNINLKDCCWSWSSNTLATCWEELTHWKRPWCWERLKVGGEGDDRGWDGWMASLTQWTRVWASPRRWWRTGKPGMLQSMGLKRVGHDRARSNWTTALLISGLPW